MVFPPPTEGEEGEPTDSLDELVSLATSRINAAGGAEAASVAAYLLVDRRVMASDPARVETTVKRVVAFATALGCQRVTAALFNEAIDSTFVLNDTQWSGVVQEKEQQLGPVFGPSYFEPMIEWVGDHHAENLTERPAFAVVDTISDDPADVLDAHDSMGYSLTGWDFQPRDQANQTVDAFEVTFDHVRAMTVTSGTTDEQAFDHMIDALNTTLTAGS